MYNIILTYIILLHILNILNPNFRHNCWIVRKKLKHFPYYTQEWNEKKNENLRAWQVLKRVPETSASPWKPWTRNFHSAIRESRASQDCNSPQRTQQSFLICWQKSYKIDVLKVFHLHSDFLSTQYVNSLCKILLKLFSS